MDLNEHQAERIARWLDGEGLELSGEERTAAETIRRREGLLGELLNVEVPQETHVHVAAAIRRELSRGRRRILRMAIDVAAVAAAAVVLVALLLPGGTPAPAQAVPTAVLFEDAYRSTAATELDDLAEQIDQVEARLVADVPPVPEEGLPTPAANSESGRIFDDPWLEELLQGISS